MPVNLNNTGSSGFQPPSGSNVSRMTVSEYNKQNQGTWSPDTKVAFSYGGKTYMLNDKQYDWIKSRWQNDNAGTYGYDVEDQKRKAAGQMSSAVYNSYKGGIDEQLRDLGLPSIKKLDSYLEGYQKWHTGGMDQYFGQMNLPKNYWTNVKGWYQSDMQNAYENTAEDQQRKARGLMPSKWEAKYTDTEIDDQLRARGLPPISEFNTYANRYSNYQGIENFYANVAYNETNLRLAGITDDSTEQSYGGKKQTGHDFYVDAFYDELELKNDDGSYVYAPIRAMFKNGSKPSSATSTGDYAYDRGTDILAANKDEASDEDYANYNAFSYDDYKKHYDDLYNRYFANAQTGNGQLVSDALAVKQMEADEAATKAYYTVGKTATEAKAFADKYTADYPDATPEQMFTDMAKHNVPDTEAYKVYEEMKKKADGTSLWYDVVNGWTKTYGGVWSNVNDSDAPIPDVAKPLTDEQRDAQREKDRVKAAQQYGRAIMNGDDAALNNATERANVLGYNSPDDMVAALKEDKSDEFVQAVKDAIAVYESAMAAYEDTYPGYGAPSPESREPINKANEALNALGFKSVHDAIRYVGGEKEAMSPGKYVAQKSDEMTANRKAKKEAYANDTEAIDATRAEIESQLFGDVGAPLSAKEVREVVMEYDNALVSDDRAALYDATQKLRALGIVNREAADEWLRTHNDHDAAEAVNPNNLDVDSVIQILDAVKKDSNPVAFELALKDLGFNDGDYSGAADDLTYGWSDADKRKLAFYLGGGKLSDRTYDEVIPGFNRAEGDTIGDTWADAGVAQDKQRLNPTDFSIDLEWVLQQVNAGKMTEEEGYNLLAANGYQKEMEYYMPEEWHRAHFIENTAPGLWNQSREEDLLLWEEMTPEQQREASTAMWDRLTDEQKASMYRENWWEYDPSVYRTFGQALEQQFRAVLPGLAAELIGTPVKVADAIGANMSGRPNLWKTTETIMKLQQGIGQLGAVTDNVNGAKVAQVASDVAQEILRMEVYGTIGGIAKGAFTTTKVGSAIAGVAAAKGGSKVVKKAADMFLSMVGSSPFVVSAFANNYGEAKALGASNSEATWFSMITGLLEGALEGFEFDELYGRTINGDKFAKQLLEGAQGFKRMGIVGKARVASMVVSGGGEFTEESIGYVVETALKMRHSDTWGKGTEWSANDWLEQAMMGFLTGALGGGLHSIGSITADSLIKDYAMHDEATFRAVFPDLVEAVGRTENLPEATRRMYEKGGATVLSADALQEVNDQIKRCDDGIANAPLVIEGIEDKAQKKIDSAYEEVRKYDAKLAPYASMDTLSGEDALIFSDLIDKRAAAQRRFEAESKAIRSEADEQIEQAKNALKGAQDQKAILEKKVQEHWAGVYFSNKAAIIDGLTDEIVANLANSYQNGSRYEAADLTGAAAEGAELVRKGANNPVQTKLAEAEATETIEEAKETAEAPENAAVKARELAYDRVYKDHEAGKAYAEERGKSDSKLTPVEFAENERQNFQAKTTAKLRRVTLELAGLEAKEGMSAKEIFEEAKKAMTPEAAQKLDMYQKLSKALGLNMVVRDVVAGTSGYVHDGKLYVTLNGKQSMLRVAAHELTHYMKGHAETQYDALRTSLVNEVGQEKFDELLQEKAQEYGLDLNDAKARLEADDEVCAELCEKMLENPDALERFVQSDLDAAKTLKQRLAKTLVAIKSAIRSIGTSNAETKADLIKQQDTIEQWYKGLSDAIDNANKAGKTTATTEAETATVADTTTEAPQAPPVETNPDLFMGEESARREQLRSDLEALAKKGTKVQDVSRQEINDVLDRVILGDKSNYNKADYAQIRGMLAQLIPEVTAYVNGDATVDANVLNERLSAAIDYMLERYGEGSEDYYNLRDLIPSKIALTDTAYKDLRAKDMTLRQASNELTKALGGKFVNFVYKKAPSYNNAMTIDELWQTITDQYGEQNGVGNIGEDALALIDYVRERADNRTSFNDLYGSQREDMVNTQVGEFLDAVQSMVEGKSARKAALHKIDDDYMPLAEKYDAGIATDADVEEMQRDVDEAARDNDYTIKAYHGTTEDFTEFNRGTQGQNHDGYLEFGGGFYFTPDAGEAREWVSRGRSGMSGEATPRVMAVYLNPGRILGADDAVPGGADYLRSMWLSSADANFIANRAYRFINYLTEERGFSNTEVQDTLKALGFDAIDATFGQGKSGQYVVFDPEQIKSADPVTYDDNGDIIPLSERFNPDSRDIRWSVDDDLVNQYGAIEQGREPRARDVQVPRQSADNMRVSKFTRSLDESSKVTDAQSAEIESEIGSEADRVKQLWSYIPKSNDETMRKAKEFIAARQPATAQREFHDMVVAGKYGTRTAAIGLQLLSDASARDDWASVKDIAYDLRVLATEAGQSAQIFNVLKDLKGVGSAWYVEKLVNSLNSTYADEISSGQMDPITVSEEAMQKVRAAKTQAEVDAAEKAVADEIGPQLPLKRDEKLSNWRYLSMLGNPVTHIRNVTGNNLMHLMGGMKDVVASGVQRILEKTGVTDESDRAHARLTSADKSYWDDFAQKSYDEQKRNLQGGGKLGFQSLVQQSKRSFDNKVLDTIARGKDPGTMSERKGLVGLLQNIRNNGAMGMLEVEDAWGLEKNYKRSLMEYMKAQGYSLNNEGKVGKVGKDGSFTEITNEQMNKAIEWATNQAWTNTFRGPSALATELNKISKMNTASKLIVEGVMPFKKTPINIAKQGAMYSPAGIVIGTTELLTKVKQGKMSAATAIDHLSSGLTGTALMALGVVLAKAGILRGGGEDKKKLETYLEDTGDQTYAFKFGNVSINMSAIAPATIPLFMGVALQEMLSRNGEDEGVDLSTITDVLAGTLNPFMEMSFMSSLNSALKNYNNEGIGGALGSTIMTAAQNYGSQYLPTLGGKVAQFIDPTQRTTKSSATSPVGGNMDYYWRSLVKKVPGAEATLQPDVNIWGQTTTKDSFGDWALDFANKFILPTNVKVTNRDAVDNELIRVVESTGIADFLPSDGNKYFTVKGEKYKMNASQYTEYSKDRGQAAYAALKDVMAGASYKNATDEQKAELLKKALDNAYKSVNNVWKEKLGAYDK